MAYKDVNVTTWTYEKDGEFIEGELLHVESDVGVNKATVYSIQTSEGAKSIWGSKILDSLMALVKVGDNIKIIYKGLAEAQKGKKPAKIFKVQVDDGKD